MNSIASSFRADPAGNGPKQHDAVSMLELNDGNKIPMLAYGLGTANYSAPSEHVIKATTTAIKAGFFHLDGAEMYGNEVELGKAIASSGVDRSSLFVTTKLNNKPEHCGQVATIFQQSLDRLGLDYVDLYLIHHPAMAEGDPGKLQSLWAEVEAIARSGRAKSIGVSNFLASDLEIILKTATIVPAINQIEFHPYYQRQQVVALCRKHGIAVSAYAPLTPIIRIKDGPLTTPQESSFLASIAKKYGVNEADVLLRWCIDQGVVAITTSSNEVRLASYMSNIPQFKLTPKEVETISETGGKAFHRCFWTKKFEEGDTR